MIYRSTINQITEYFNSNSINQSAIVEILDKGIQSFLAHQEILRQEQEGVIPEKEVTHYKVGKAVDINLTGTPEEFANTFHISKLTKLPGDKSMLVLKSAFKLVSEQMSGKIRGLNAYPNQLETAMDAIEFRANWGMDKRTDAIVRENGEAYWQDLVDGLGKKILSGIEVNKAKIASDNFRSHPNTAHFLTKDHPNHIDIIFQFAAYWLFGDIRCKSLLDELYIDHLKRAIYPLDYKTIGKHILQFNRSISERRYDIQASFYTEGLSESLEKVSNIIGKDVTDYEIKNFGFLVESTVSPGTPLAFVLDNDLLALGKLGDSRWKKGWVQGVQIYDEWRQNDFSLEKRFPDGMIMVGKDFNYLENF